MSNSLNLFEIAKKSRMVTLIFWFLIASFFADTNGFGSRVIIMDVGQGDAILIQDSGYNFLIDCGYDDAALYKIYSYTQFGNNKIDILIISHPHYDHIGGCLDIIDRFDIGEVWINDVDYELIEWEVLRSLESVRLVEKGDVVSTDNLLFEVLFPFENGEMVGNNVNNASIVLLLESEHNRVLFTGDAEAPVETLLLNEFNLRMEKDDSSFKIDLLKAGHHCSKSSSSQSFLQIINPDIAVCSAGLDNKFNHPSPEVIDRFELLGIDYHITFLDGDYIFDL